MSNPEDFGDIKGMSRRELLQRAGMIGAGALATTTMATWGSSPAWASLIERAAAVKPAGSDLGAVEHIIFLMMENRSYDHYFGAYPRGRGFGDHQKHKLGVFAQPYSNYAANYPHGAPLVPANTLLPFHLNSRAGFECTDDLTHDWGPMHECWNHGKMNRWVDVHTSAAQEGARGVTTMGYYTRQDLPFYWALADHFTLCDGYHASILGPTHPNRLMQMSGTIDPDGTHGGPIVATNTGFGDHAFSCTWTTMPEVLEGHGVSWKVYTPSNAGVTGKYKNLKQYPTWDPKLYHPASGNFVMELTDMVLPYFTAYQKSGTPLYTKAFDQTFPNQFVSDIHHDKLPKVSWIIPPLGFDEHPSASSRNGEYFTSLVLDALVANPKVWAKTALFLMYDENDGWFDHVKPPTAPSGTPGEYLKTSTFPTGETTPDTLGITGPLGLGVRVPALMISPFSRGGHIASHTFDHTSQLKLIAKRWGVNVPNVSNWRRKTVGDLTSTMFHSKTNAKLPKLPKVSVLMPVGGTCGATLQTMDSDIDAAVGKFPRKQRMPTQHGTTDPASKYFALKPHEVAVSDAEMIEIGGEGKATAKSSHNKLLAETS
jgi:phospholipase C